MLTRSNILVLAVGICGLMSLLAPVAHAESIGPYYANSIVLIPPDSPDHPGEMGSQEVVDINNDGRDDVVFEGQLGNVWDPAHIDIFASTEAGTVELITNTL